MSEVSGNGPHDTGASPGGLGATPAPEILWGTHFIFNWYEFTLRTRAKTPQTYALTTSTAGRSKALKSEIFTRKCSIR